MEGDVLRRLFSLGLGFILVAQPTYAQTPAAVSTADRHHPFVEHVEGRYTKYLAAESQGDAEASPAQRETIWQMVAQAMGKYQDATGILRIPTETLCVVGKA